MKILVTDGMEKTNLEKLQEMNVQLTNQYYPKEELLDEISKYNVVIVRSKTKIDKDVIDASLKDNNLKLIIRAGVGLDNIDLDYAQENGIMVRNTPNASSGAVAELVLGHIFIMARFLHNSNITMRKGEWNKKQYQGIEISGKTLGIIGFGRIGKELAKKASALGMKIKFYDLLDQEEYDLKYKYSDFNELLETSDFISIHVPLNKEKGALIGKDEIAKMKDQAYLINCARGGVVDEEALINALDSNKLAGAAIDVYMNEPNPNTRLCNHDKVSTTPHIGASTKEAQMKIGEEIRNIIEEFIKEGVNND